MAKQLDKDIIKRFLNLEIAYVDTGIDEIEEGTPYIDVFEPDDYLDYPTLINGLDRFLTDDIDVETFFLWASIGLVALEISLGNGTIIDQDVYSAWEQVNDEIFDTEKEHEITATKELVRRFRNFVKSHFTLKPSDEVKRCWQTIDKFEKRKRHSQEDLDNYFEALLKLGELGDPEALTYVGGMYYSGRNVEQDFEKARYYYQLASIKGSAQGTINLGYIYYYARCGGEPDYVAAQECFWRAFHIGNDEERVESAYKIFDLIFNGYGLARDLEACKDIIDDSLYLCKYIKKEQGSCLLFGDIYMRYARLYSKDGIEDNPELRLKYLKKAQKEIKARWDGVWIGDKKLLEECDKGIKECQKRIQN